jgi:hypothetical protein
MNNKAISSEQLGPQDVAVVIRAEGGVEVACTGVGKGPVMDTANLPSAEAILMAFTLFHMINDEELMGDRIEKTSEHIGEVMKDMTGNA